MTYIVFSHNYEYCFAIKNIVYIVVKFHIFRKTVRIHFKYYFRFWYCFAAITISLIIMIDVNLYHRSVFLIFIIVMYVTIFKGGDYHSRATNITSLVEFHEFHLVCQFQNVLLCFGVMNPSWVVLV